MIIAGIDPGKTGALAIVYPDGTVFTWDVPLMKVKGKEKPAWGEWHTTWMSALQLSEPGLVVIEDVASRPAQGVVSVGSFLRTLGFAHALAVASGARIEFVTPSVWKGKLGLLNSDKNASREKMRTLFPQAAGQITRVKDGDRAEATLLAYYGRKYLC